MSAREKLAVSFFAFETKFPGGDDVAGMAAPLVGDEVAEAANRSECLKPSFAIVYPIIIGFNEVGIVKNANGFGKIDFRSRQFSSRFDGSQENSQIYVPYLCTQFKTKLPWACQCPIFSTGSAFSLLVTCPLGQVLPARRRRRRPTDMPMVLRHREFPYLFRTCHHVEIIEIKAVRGGHGVEALWH